MDEMNDENVSGTSANTSELQRSTAVSAQQEKDHFNESVKRSTDGDDAFSSRKVRRVSESNYLNIVTSETGDDDEEESVIFVPPSSTSSSSSFLNDTFLSTQPEESDEIAKAIELSIQHQALFDELRNDYDLTTESSDIEYLSIPTKELSFLLQQCRYNIELKFGVKLEFPFDKNGEDFQYQVKITGKDDIIALIAKQAIKEMFQNPSFLEKELQLLKEQKLHIFIDLSNIFIASQYISTGQEALSSSSSRRKRKEEVIRDIRIRVKIEELDKLISSGRTIHEKMVFGSESALDNAGRMWKKWSFLNYKIAFSRRKKGENEQFVDDALIAQIQNSLLTFSSPPHPVHTLILLTGDGNENFGRASFYDSVGKALMQGWKVELWSWKRAMSQNYKNYQSSYCDTDRFKIFYLDDYRESITYLEKNVMNHTFNNNTNSNRGNSGITKNVNKKKNKSQNNLLNGDKNKNGRKRSRPRKIKTLEPRPRRSRRLQKQNYLKLRQRSRKQKGNEQRSTGTKHGQGSLSLNEAKEEDSHQNRTVIDLLDDDADEYPRGKTYDQSDNDYDNDSEEDYEDEE
jgi:hypothetical protein